MHSRDTATETWRPAPGGRDHFDDLVIMIDSSHFPSPTSEDQQRAGVEGEVGRHGAERAAAGEEPVLFGGVNAA